MRAMLRKVEWLGVSLMAVLSIAACEEETQKPDTQKVEPTKPKAAQGQACQKNQDCDDGLGCSKQSKCETYKTIECRGREQTCKGEGRCTGSDGRCVAGSDEECRESKLCETDGRCTAKDGKCVAASAKDCATICEMQGRCTVEDGNCIAASREDCKESSACKTADRCVAKLGRCVSIK